MRSLTPLLLLFPLLCAAPLAAQDDAAEAPPPPEAVRHAADIERANALIESGRAGEAVEILRPIAEQDLAELGPESPYVVKAFSNLSYALSAAGDHATARDTADRALELARAQGEPSVSTAMVKRNLAEIAERMGELAEAGVWIEEACRDLEATFGRTPMLAETREVGARIAFAAGDLDAAQDHLERALAIHERFVGVANEATARPLGPIASILAQRGQLRGAVLLHQTQRRVLEASGAAGSPAWQQALQREIGLLTDLGELALARRASEVLEGDVDAESSAEERFEHLLATGAARLDTGNAAGARAALESALTLVAELPQSEVAQDLRCLLPLAEARLLVGDAEGALAAAERASERDLSGFDPRLGTAVAMLRARALLALDRAADARPILVDAFHALREDAGESSPALRDILLVLLRCEERARGASVGLVDLVEMVEAPLDRTPPASLAATMRAAIQRGETSFLGSLVQGIARLVEAKPERAPALFAALERARRRELLASLAWRVESAEALAHPALGRHLAALRAIEAGARTESGEPVDLAPLQESRSRFEPLLGGADVTIDQARALLTSDDHVLVQYLWTDADAWAWVIARDASKDAIVRLASCASLAPKLAAAQAALRDLDALPDLAPLAKELLYPVLAQIESASRATIVANGPLAYVPYESLPLPGGEPWIERCRVAYAPSIATLLVQAHPAPAGETIVHVGPIVEHGELTLSHELLALRERFEVHPGHADEPDLAPVLPEGEVQLASERARESVIVEESASGLFSGVRAVVLAAPTYVDTEVPSASGIVLSPEAPDDGRPGWRLPNGFLDAGEIAALDLDAALVLLPMVETGPRPAAPALRSDALHALVTSLARAGARTIALTSFTTGDNRARLFDGSVLAHARSDAPAEALANAQRDWLRRARTQGDRALAHPGIWARWRAFGL